MQKFNKKNANHRAAKIVASPKPKVYGDARDNPDYGRARCTMPPRQRDGKTYAGGRPLRRALTRLAISQKGTLEARAIAGKGGKVNKSERALQMPGAMRP